MVITYFFQSDPNLVKDNDVLWDQYANIFLFYPELAAAISCFLLNKLSKAEFPDASFLLDSLLIVSIKLGFFFGEGSMLLLLFLWLGVLKSLVLLASLSDSSSPLLTPESWCFFLCLSKSFFKVKDFWQMSHVYLTPWSLLTCFRSSEKVLQT